MSELKKSTVLGASANLAKLCIGAGIMALPRATTRGGVIFAPVCLALLAYWNKLASVMLIRCHEFTKHSERPAGLSSLYSKIAYSAAGWSGVAVTDGSVVATLIGVTISYQMLFANLIHKIPWITCSKETLTLLFAVVVLPLSCARDLRSIAKFSMSGLICMVAALSAILLYGAITYGDPLTGGDFPLQAWPQSVGDFTAYIGIATFGFGICCVAFPVYESMEEPSKFQKAATYSLIFCWAVYVVVGNVLASLFVQDPDGVNDNILANLPTDSLAASLVRISMASVCILSFPLAMVPPAQIIEQLLFTTIKGWFCGSPDSVGREESYFVELSTVEEAVVRVSASITRPVMDKESEMEDASDPMAKHLPISAMGRGGRGYDSIGGNEATKVSMDEISGLTDDYHAGGGLDDVSLVNTPQEGRGTPPLAFSTLVCNRTVLVLFSTYVSINLPCFSMIVSLIGCLTVSMLSFVLPPFFHMLLVSSKLPIEPERKLLPEGSPPAGRGRGVSEVSLGFIDIDDEVIPGVDDVRQDTSMYYSHVMYYRDALFLFVGSIFCFGTTYITYLDIMKKLQSSSAC